MGFTAIMTAARLWNSTDEQVFDLAYYIRYNKGQVRLDKVTYGSALLGGVAGVAALPGGALNGSLQGASIGVGLAVLAHVKTDVQYIKYYYNHVGHLQTCNHIMSLRCHCQQTIQFRYTQLHGMHVQCHTCRTGHIIAHAHMRVACW